MSNVIVTPRTIADSREWLQKYLEESDEFVITHEGLSNADLLELGGEATIVATGSWDSVRTFAQLVAWHSEMEGEHEGFFDVSGPCTRLEILGKNATYDKNRRGRFEVKVTSSK